MPSAKSSPAKTRDKFGGYGMTRPHPVLALGVAREARPRPKVREVQRAAAHIVYNEQYAVTQPQNAVPCADKSRTVTNPGAYYAEENILLGGKNLLDYWYMKDPEYWAKVRPGGKLGIMPAEIAVDGTKKKKKVAKRVVCLSMKDLEARWQDALTSHVGLSGAKEGKPPVAGSEDNQEAQAAIHQFVAMANTEYDSLPLEGDVAASAGGTLEAAAGRVAAAASLSRPSSPPRGSPPRGSPKSPGAGPSKPTGKVEMKIPSVGTPARVHYDDEVEANRESNRRTPSSHEPVMH